MSDAPSKRERPELDEAPPVLGSWPALYGLVLGALALLVVVFALVTERYR